MKSFLIYSLSLFILIISGCSKDKIPGVYRIDIQQGNEVTQEMLSKLEAGMTKSQVNYVMGTPLIIDTFHPNRWDYIYSFQPGNDDRQQRRITLYFDDAETLTHIEGNTRIVENIELAEEERTETNVVVPLTDSNTSLFERMLNAIGLGDPEAEIIDDGEETDAAESDPELQEQAESLPDTPASVETEDADTAPQEDTELE